MLCVQLLPTVSSSRKSVIRIFMMFSICWMISTKRDRIVSNLPPVWSFLPENKDVIVETAFQWWKRKTGDFGFFFSFHQWPCSILQYANLEYIQTESFFFILGRLDAIVYSTTIPLALSFRVRHKQWQQYVDPSCDHGRINLPDIHLALKLGRLSSLILKRYLSRK